MILKNHANHLEIDIGPLRHAALDAPAKKIFTAAIQEFIELQKVMQDLRIIIYAEAAFKTLTAAGIALSEEDFRRAFLENDELAKKWNLERIARELLDRLIAATAPTYKRLHYKIAADLEKVADEFSPRLDHFLSVFKNPAAVDKTHLDTLRHFIPGIRAIGDAGTPPGQFSDQTQRFAIWGDEFRAAKGTA